MLVVVNQAALAEWLNRPADRVAPELLGAKLTVTTASGVKTVQIIETEAYVGEQDAACHAARGVTPRTRVMYGPAGRAYVYLVYGLHHLFNVVVAPLGEPHAVLVRAVEPCGFDARTHGPGLWTKALGVNLSDNNASVHGSRFELQPPATPVSNIAVGPRIGVGYAGRWADAPLRFGLAGHPRLSKPFPACHANTHTT
jgi:DNA-3-methyladenine glycosylase